MKLDVEGYKGPVVHLLSSWRKYLSLIFFRAKKKGLVGFSKTYKGVQLNCIAISQGYFEHQILLKRFESMPKHQIVAT